MRRWHFHNRRELATFVAGRQAGLRSASETLDAIIEQLLVYRRELKEAKAEHAAKMAAARAHFENEAALMRREMEAMITELKIDAFSRITRGDGELLN